MFVRRFYLNVLFLIPPTIAVFLLFFIYTAHAQSTDTTAPRISEVKVSNITVTTADVEWKTDEPSDTRVEYCESPTRCGINSSLRLQLVTDHSIRLAGLSPATTYFIWVKSGDQSGNLRVLGYFIFSTSPDNELFPAAQGIPPIDLGYWWCEVEDYERWAGTWVRRGTTNVFDARWKRPGLSDVTAVLTMTVNDGNVFIQRRNSSDGNDCDYTGYSSNGINVSGSFGPCTKNPDGPPGQWSADINGACYSAPTPTPSVTLSPTPVPSISPSPSVSPQNLPTISNIKISDITRDSAVVTWDTNVPTDSGVLSCFLVFICYKQLSYNSSLVTSHSANLSGFKADSKVSIRVVSKDAGGLESVGNISFRTAPGLIISDVEATTTQAEITVSWETNYPANSTLRICRFFFFCSSTVFDPTIKSSHSLTVGSLKPGTRYLYNIVSTDDSGYTRSINTYITTLP